MISVGIFSSLLFSCEEAVARDVVYLKITASILIGQYLHDTP